MRPPRRHDAQPAPAPWKFWAGMAVCGLCGAFGSRYGAEHGQAYLGAAAGSILGGFAYYRLAFARRRKPETAAEPRPEIPERSAPRYPPPVRPADASPSHEEDA
jgi:hypothetical protein